MELLFVSVGALLNVLSHLDESNFFQIFILKRCIDFILIIITWARIPRKTSA